MPEIQEWIALLAKKVLAAIKQWLAAARRALLGSNSAAAPSLDHWPDPVTWTGQVDEFILPDLAQAYTEAFTATTAPVGAAPLETATIDAYRSTRILTARNRLASFTDTSWQELRQSLDEGIAGGETIQQLRDRVTAVLNPGRVNADSGARTWQWMAERIARTEVMAAVNGATYDSGLAHAQAYGLELGKVWLAHDDERTRHTHRIADKQVRALTDPFIIGGFPMDFPGDPTAPPGETVNCRCSVGVVEMEDTREDAEEYARRLAAMPPEDVALLTAAGESAGPQSCCGDVGAEPMPGWEDPALASHLRGPLRRYWLYGVGAAKIAWGVPGDFKRCVSELRRHFPVFTEGLCANLHKDATGSWPGREHSAVVAAGDGPGTGVVVSEPVDGQPGIYRRWRAVLGIVNQPSGDGRVLADQGTLRAAEFPLPFMYQPAIAPGHDGAVSVGSIDRAWMAGNEIWGEGTFDLEDPWGREASRKAAAGYMRWVSIDPDDVTEVDVVVDENGQEVHDPATAVEDGAELTVLKVYARWRLRGATMVPYSAFPEATMKELVAAVSGDLRLPLAGRDVEWEGQVAAQRVAAWASSDGELDPDKYGRAFFWRDSNADPTLVGSYKLGFADVIDGQLRAVPRGVFAVAAVLQGARGGVDISEREQDLIREAVTEYYGRMSTEFDDPSIVPPWLEVGIEESDSGGGESGEMVADAEPVVFLTAAGQGRPPAAWFERAILPGPTPLTVTDDGRVFGHLAAWDTCHTSFSDTCVKPPKSATGYAHFHLGEVVTAEGFSLAVGKLTVGTGHASPDARSRAAAAHYDHTGAAVAVVRAYEDEYGIAVFGALTADATGEQVDVLRRSPLSGDWRRIGGNLELIAALAVNVPGFPVLRPTMSSRGDVPVAVTAAGVFDQSFYGDGRTQVDVEALAQAVAASVHALGRRRERITALAASLANQDL